MNPVNQDPTEQLRRSWEANAAGWSRAVAEGAIPSRARGTNAAIADAVVGLSPRRVLDLGCGEGWLARHLAALGISVVGVDASATLIQHARAQGGGTFHVRSYDEIIENPTALGKFDAVIANFALLHEDISPLLRATRASLGQDGALLIQTVHPWAAKGAAYRDGWRTETFAGFGEGFVESMPWYFRTLSSWVGTLRESGYAVDELVEPIDEGSGEPLSLLIIARPVRPGGRPERPGA